MRIRALLVIISLYLVLVFSAREARAFSRDLWLGDFGPDVLLLQQILNRDVDTRLASSGPGSPGKETEYFGPRTESAVKRFQKKYSQDILAPLGLGIPTGFVGQLTRAKLKLIVAELGSPVAPKSNSPTTSVSPLNPNLVNIDFYLEKIAELERKSGVSEETIQEHRRFIRNYAASTSTDFRAQFEAELKKGLTGDSTVNSVAVWRRLFDLFAGWILEQVNAASGAPFGGPIVYVYPCSCPPGIFSLSIGPPSAASILDYVAGTQAFLSQNLPAAKFLVGLYTPGVKSCWQLATPSCFPIPSEGQIQPMVGSSPL